MPTTIKGGDDGRVIDAPLEVAGKTWQVGRWVVRITHGIKRQTDRQTDGRGPAHPISHVTHSQ